LYRYLQRIADIYNSIKDICIYLQISVLNYQSDFEIVNVNLLLIVIKSMKMKNKKTTYHLLKLFTVTHTDTCDISNS